MDPALRHLLQTTFDEKIEAVIRLEPGGLAPPDVQIVATFGDIATCRLPRERVDEVWADTDVASLKAPRVFGPDPDPEWTGEAFDESTNIDADAPRYSDVRRPKNLPVDGRGVIVAVVDWGFDWHHPNFLDDTGSTRILALWDQTAPGPGVEPYGYGRVFERDEINSALRTPHPFDTLGYHPAHGDPTGRGAHGTHVLDIAAGSGRARNSPQGIAPGADLLLVHLAARGTGGLANLGDSVTLLEALDWIRRRAGEIPFVCNLSVGRHGGPHTGLTLVERGIDWLLTEKPGRCIVQSTGNYYAANVHTAGQLRPGQTRVFHWITDQADVTPNELEIWYSKHDVMRVDVQGPGDLPRLSVPLGQDDRIERDGVELLSVFHRANDPATGDTHVDMFLSRAAPPGMWIVSLIAEDVIDGRYHAWVERDAACPGCQSRLAPDEASPMSTTGTVCNGFRSVVVGAYSAHDEDRPLARFSSSGPTVDGRIKPDLVAPGVRVLAARSAASDEPVSSGKLTRMSGSSMAAPHVTGAIACVFAAVQRPLSIQETRTMLLSSAEPLDATASPNDLARAGSGYLDIERAVQAALAARPRMTEEDSVMIVDREWTGEANENEERGWVDAYLSSVFATERVEADPVELPSHTCACRSHQLLAPAETGIDTEQWTFTPKVKTWLDGVDADLKANESLLLYVRFHPQPRMAIVRYLHGVKARKPWAKDLLKELSESKDLNAALDEIAEWIKVTNFDHSKRDEAFGARFEAEKKLRDDLWEAIEKIATWRRVRAYQVVAVVEEDKWKIAGIGWAFVDYILKTDFPRLYQRIKRSAVPSSIYEEIGWQFRAIGSKRLAEEPRFKQLVAGARR